jgi:hypothetical protein
MIQFTKKPRFNYIVINKKFKPKDGIIVPIHRTSPSGSVIGSPLGNPFFLKDINNDVERDKVCDDYENWIIDKIRNNDSKIINELQRIRNLHSEYGKVYLQCFCKPKRCHGDTIVKILKGEIKI